MKLKTIKTTKLEIAYLQHGPSEGNLVLCLHGFPNSARAFEKVMEQLAIKGDRTIAPFVRGVLPTKFMDASSKFY